MQLASSRTYLFKSCVQLASDPINLSSYSRVTRMYMYILMICSRVTHECMRDLSYHTCVNVKFKLSCTVCEQKSTKNPFVWPCLIMLSLLDILLTDQMGELLCNNNQDKSIHYKLLTGIWSRIGSTGCLKDKHSGNCSYNISRTGDNASSKSSDENSERPKVKLKYHVSFPRYLS